MEPLLILKFWRECVIGTLLVLVSLLWVMLDSTRMELKLIEVQTEKAREQSDETIETLRSAIPVMVEQATTNAVANYKKRFPAPVCSPWTDRVLPDTGGSQAGSTANPNATSRELMAADAEFITACARDAARLDLWIEWATLNELKVK